MLLFPEIHKHTQKYSYMNIYEYIKNSFFHIDTLYDLKRWALLYMPFLSSWPIPASKTTALVILALTLNTKHISHCCYFFLISNMPVLCLL